LQVVRRGKIYKAKLAVIGLLSGFQVLLASLAAHVRITPSILALALELASKALESLGCPVTLDHRDFIEA
jgi:hypothetical protein